jgi:hypothetical protein
LPKRVVVKCNVQHNVTPTYLRCHLDLKSGWLGWANFCPSGVCLLWVVFLKKYKSTQPTFLGHV